MDWDEAEKAADEATQGGMFLGLKGDGDKAVVAFCGKPHRHEVFWTGSGYEPYDKDKHDGKPSAQFKLNVFNIAESAMQIWEVSGPTFKGVIIVKKKYGLDKKTFEITRSGAKGDTKTTYSILPEHDIDKDLAERLATEQLHDLTDGGTPGAKDSGGNRDVLMDMVKALPVPARNEFLKQTEVKQLKDIPANKLIDALALAKKLGEAPADNDVDPFAS